MKVRIRSYRIDRKQNKVNFYAVFNGKHKHWSVPQGFFFDCLLKLDEVEIEEDAKITDKL